MSNSINSTFSINMFFLLQLNFEILLIKLHSIIPIPLSGSHIMSSLAGRIYKTVQMFVRTITKRLFQILYEVYNRVMIFATVGK